MGTKLTKEIVEDYLHIDDCMSVDSPLASPWQAGNQPLRQKVLADIDSITSTFDSAKELLELLKNDVEEKGRGVRRKRGHDDDAMLHEDHILPEFTDALPIEFERLGLLRRTSPSGTSELPAL